MHVCTEANNLESCDRATVQLTSSQMKQEFMLKYQESITFR